MDIDKNKKIVNVPETELPSKPLTLEEVKEASESRGIITPRGLRINKELSQGLDFIKKYPRSVSFFGSARFAEDNPHYQKAQAIARKISQELNYAIVTGGGPGIMEAANRGAQESGGASLGFGIELPEEQRMNPYIKDISMFRYFFTRKVALAFSAEAYLFFPGGVGTLDEFFELITLIQTRKIAKVPLILVGNDFWQPIHNFIKNVLYEKHKTIDKADMDLYTMTEDEEEILDIIRNAPMRNE